MTLSCWARRIALLLREVRRSGTATAETPEKGRLSKDGKRKDYFLFPAGSLSAQASLLQSGVDTRLSEPIGDRGVGGHTCTVLGAQGRYRELEHDCLADEVVEHDRLAVVYSRDNVENGQKPPTTSDAIRAMIANFPVGDIDKISNSVFIIYIVWFHLSLLSINISSIKSISLGFS